MNFIEAIQEYKMITNDGGKTHYYKDAIDGMIFKSINGCGKIFNVTVDLLTSTGWVEHQEHKLILPERVDYSELYLYIESDSNTVYTDSDGRFEEDVNRLKTFNYFTDRELAQYVADKQLIQRIELVLHELNFERFGKADRCELINEYILDNYRDIVNRINEYESRNRV